MEVAVLITSYNERDTLERCLRDCYYQTDAVAAGGNYTFSVYVSDGGSTDGTSDMVESEFPKVHFVRGLAGPHWNINMRLAWEEASKTSPDLYLWLSRKIVLREGAIASMLENSERLSHKAILAGSVADPDGVVIKGGRTRGLKNIEPDSTIPVPCITFDGYLTLIPKSVYAVLGNLDPHYVYRYADFDYGIRAYKSRITRVIAPGILADGKRMESVPVWRDSDYSLRERYKFLIGPQGRPPRELFRFDIRRTNIFGAVYHLVAVFVRVLFPKRKTKNQ